MPGARINGPVSPPDAPNPTKDAARERELIEEFFKHLEYLTQHSRMARQLLGYDLAFNNELERLKRAVAQKPPRPGKQSRLHPEIEW